MMAHLTFFFFHFGLHCDSLAYPAKFPSVGRDRSAYFWTVEFKILQQSLLEHVLEVHLKARYNLNESDIKVSM